MAEHTTVRRTCDKVVKRRGAQPAPHGVEVEVPTRFSVDGEAYKIDLCDEHRAELISCLQPFIEDASRDVSPATGVRASMRGKSGVFTTKDVREWMRAQGREVSESGRLPTAAIKEYEQAHRP